MGGAFRLFGLLAIIPTTLLLTVSFFVLFTMRKLDAPGLKIFGYVLAVLLWIAAAIVFSAGLYMMATGQHPMMQMMQQMQQMKHPMMQQPMMKP